MPSVLSVLFFLHTTWKYNCPTYYPWPTTQYASVDIGMQPLSDRRWRCSATEQVWWPCPAERTRWFSSTERWCPGSSSPGHRKQDEIFKSITRQQAGRGGVLGFTSSAHSVLIPVGVRYLHKRGVRGFCGLALVVLDLDGPEGNE